MDRPGAEQWVPDRPSYGSLAEALPQCRGCELHEDATQAVMGQGRTDAPLMMVGEQPGDKEDLAGKPFVGPAGQLLVRALGDAGIEPQDVYRTNVVKHFRWRPRGKQRIHQSPAQAHVTACAPWLEAEFSLLRPTGVVLLGGTAGKALYGTGFRVGEARGVLTDWPVDRIPLERPPAWVLATTHPSAVLRADDRQAVYDGLVADLRLVVQALAA